MAVYNQSWENRKKAEADKPKPKPKKATKKAEK